jgi:flagellar biosynthesis protein FliQ
MLLSAKLAMPVLLVALGIGFAVSLLQAVTQVQEVTLSFVPKLIGVAMVILVAGHWMLQETVAFTKAMFTMLPQLLG